MQYHHQILYNRQIYLSVYDYLFFIYKNVIKILKENSIFITTNQFFL